MKSILSLILGISCFAISGNTQDSGEALPYGPAATAFNTQGNVAYNRTQAERELARAAQEARKLKELMYTRASQSGTPPPSPPRTAAEFLAANKPPPMPPSDEPRPPVRTSRDYVPPFETQTNTSAPAPAPTAGLPKKEGGLFNLFRSRKNDTPAFEEPVGASEYQNPYQPDGIAAPEEASAPDSPPQVTSSAPDPGAMEAALQESTINEAPPAATAPVGNEKQGFFSKLFGKKNPEATPAGSNPPPPVPDAPPADMVLADAPTAPPADSGGIPEPGSFDEPSPPSAPAPAATPPSSEPAPIFQRRAAEASDGTPATVAQEGSATVNGVKVKLYQGSRVNVLSSSNGTSRIQLPDGRIGTIASGNLNR